MSAAVTPPGLLRRLASGTYDALIILAMCLLATFLIVPFTDTQGLGSFYAHDAAAKWFYQAGLLALGYAFFGGFWTHGGQTVGMQTWHLQVIRIHGAPLGWYHALIRYLTMLTPWLLVILAFELAMNTSERPASSIHRLAAAAILLVAMAAILWPAFNPQGLAWHDYFSGTRVTWVDKSRRQTGHPPPVV